MRVAIFAAIIKEDCILLVRKKKAWILPGGKPNRDEDDILCLLREAQEELPGAELVIRKFYKSIKGRTPHTCDILQAKVYFADIDGDVYPGAEVNTAAWVRIKDTGEFELQGLSDLTEKIINSLCEDGYL